MLLALRINVLAKGHSGISLSTLLQYVSAFNGIRIVQVLLHAWGDNDDVVVLVVVAILCGYRLELPCAAAVSVRRLPAC